MKRSKQEQGFTLFELMIVLVVIVIIIAVAMPNFYGIVSRNRVITSTNQVVALLQYARVTAMEKSKPVVFCPCKVTRDKNGKITKQECIDFAAGIKDFAVALLPESGNVIDPLQVLTIPNTVEITDLTSDASANIVFNKDGTHGLRGITAQDSFDDDGKTSASTPKLIDADQFVKNKLLVKVAAGGQTAAFCRTIELSVLGHPTVKRNACDG